MTALDRLKSELANADTRRVLATSEVFACDLALALAVVEAAQAFVSVAEKQLHPTPDKPHTAWAKMRAVQDALSALTKDD